MLDELEAFEKTRFNKPDPCYYVKYLVYKEELKIPYEEYYYVDEQNKDVMHRPYDWDKFLIHEGYDELVKEAT